MGDSGSKISFGAQDVPSSASEFQMPDIDTSFQFNFNFGEGRKKGYLFHKLEEVDPVNIPLPYDDDRDIRMGCIACAIEERKAQKHVCQFERQHCIYCQVKQEEHITFFVGEDKYPQRVDHFYSNLLEPEQSDVSLESTQIKGDILNKNKIKKNKKFSVKKHHIKTELAPFSSHTRRKDLFSIDPKDLSKLYSLLDLYCKSRKNTEKFHIPSFLQRIFGIRKMLVPARQLHSLLTRYNYAFNTYWVNRAFGYYTGLSFFRTKEFASIKKAHQDPFENFINNETEILKKLRKIKKEKKNKYSKNYVNLKKEVYQKYLSECGVMDTNLGLWTEKEIVSLLFSHYMCKKNIYLTIDDPDMLVTKHKELMTRDGIYTRRFEQHVRHCVRTLFSDFTWKDNDDFTIPQSTYYDGEPVPAHDFLISEGVTRYDYNRFVKTGKRSPSIQKILSNFLNNKETEHEVIIIRDKGKSRVITTNSPATFFFKAAQWNVHRHLKNKDVFKYIGAQVKKSIKLRQFNKSDWLLSGDFENSTDYIPQELTYAIWDEITKLDSFGHGHLRQLILKSLRNEVLFYPDGSKVYKKSGQLMGSLTSFPALCIMNYALANFAGLNQKKINGDDLLAFCSQDEKDTWSKLAPNCGLSVNLSKSHLNPLWGTFNSQLIYNREGSLRHIPHFQVSKLKDASYIDLLNTSTAPFFKHLEYNVAKIYSENHTAMDLFNGERLRFNDLYNLGFFFPILDVYDRLLEEGQLFMGKVGAMSKFYDPEDKQKGINGNWEHRYDQISDFYAGATWISSLNDYVINGDQTMINNIFLNLQLRRTER